MVGRQDRRCDGSGKAAGGGGISREEELKTYSSFLHLCVFSERHGHPAGDKGDTQFVKREGWQAKWERAWSVGLETLDFSPISNFVVCVSWGEVLNSGFCLLLTWDSLNDAPLGRCADPLLIIIGTVLCVAHMHALPTILLSPPRSPGGV